MAWKRGDENPSRKKAKASPPKKKRVAKDRAPTIRRGKGNHPEKAAIRRNVQLVMGLSQRQMKFADVYFKTGNGAEALRESHDVSNWQANSVYVEASKLLKQSNIQLRLRTLEERALRRLDVSADRVIAEMAKAAFLDVRKLFGEDGAMKRIVDLDDDTAAAVAGVEFEEVFDYNNGSRDHVGRIHKIKLADKLNALSKLAKWIGMEAEADGRALASGAVTLELFRRMMADASGRKTEEPNGAPRLTIDQARARP